MTFLRKASNHKYCDNIQYRHTNKIQFKFSKLPSEDGGASVTPLCYWSALTKLSYLFVETYTVFSQEEGEKTLNYYRTVRN